MRGRGAPTTNLSHNASFHSCERITPSNRGIKQLTSRALFLERLAAHDDQFIATSLRYASYGDNDLRRNGDKLRAITIDSPGWRDMALDHVRRCINRKRFNAAFCYANDQIFGMSFMKKSREKVFSEMRLNYLHAIQDRLLPPPDAILTEITDMVKKQYPDFANTVRTGCTKSHRSTPCCDLLRTPLTWSKPRIWHGHKMPRPGAGGPKRCRLP